MSRTWIASDAALAAVVRLASYTVVVFAFTASLPFLVQHNDITVFRENGPVEWLQFALLAAATGAFLLGARAFGHARELLLILMCFAAFAAVRELDALLDVLVPVLGWKIGFVFMFAAAILAVRRRDRVGAQLCGFASGRAFGLLWAGFVVAVPFAQLLGHGAFLQMLMGDDYVRYYKTVIEESGELFGYFLIFAGSVETLAQLNGSRGVRPAPLEPDLARNLHA